MFAYDQNFMMKSLYIDNMTNFDLLNACFNHKQTIIDLLDKDYGIDLYLSVLSSDDPLIAKLLDGCDFTLLRMIPCRFKLNYRT